MKVPSARAPTKKNDESYYVLMHNLDVLYLEEKSYRDDLVQTRVILEDLIKSNAVSKTTREKAMVTMHAFEKAIEGSNQFLSQLKKTRELQQTPTPPPKPLYLWKKFDEIKQIKEEIERKFNHAFSKNLDGRVVHVEGSKSEMENRQTNINVENDESGSFKLPVLLSVVLSESERKRLMMEGVKLSVTSFDVTREWLDKIIWALLSGESSKEKLLVNDPQLRDDLKGKFNQMLHGELSMESILKRPQSSDDDALAAKKVLLLNLVEMYRLKIQEQDCLGDFNATCSQQLNYVVDSMKDWKGPLEIHTASKQAAVQCVIEMTQEPTICDELRTFGNQYPKIGKGAGLLKVLTNPVYRTTRIIMPLVGMQKSLEKKIEESRKNQTSIENGSSKLTSADIQAHRLLSRVEETLEIAQRSARSENQAQAVDEDSFLKKEKFEDFDLKHWIAIKKEDCLKGLEKQIVALDQNISEKMEAQNFLNERNQNEIFSLQREIDKLQRQKESMNLKVHRINDGFNTLSEFKKNHKISNQELSVLNSNLVDLKRIASELDWLHVILSAKPSTLTDPRYKEYYEGIKKSYDQKFSEYILARSKLKSDDWKLIHILTILGNEKLQRACKVFERVDQFHPTRAIQPGQVISLHHYGNTSRARVQSTVTLTLKISPNQMKEALAAGESNFKEKWLLEIEKRMQDTEGFSNHFDIKLDHRVSQNQFLKGTLYDPVGQPLLSFKQTEKGMMVRAAKDHPYRDASVLWADMAAFSNALSECCVVHPQCIVGSKKDGSEAMGLLEKYMKSDPVSEVRRVDFDAKTKKKINVLESSHIVDLSREDLVSVGVYQNILDMGLIPKLSPQAQSVNFKGTRSIEIKENDPKVMYQQYREAMLDGFIPVVKDLKKLRKHVVSLRSWERSKPLRVGVIGIQHSEKDRFVGETTSHEPQRKARLQKQTANFKRKLQDALDIGVNIEIEGGQESLIATLSQDPNFLDEKIKIRMDDELNEKMVVKQIECLLTHGIPFEMNDRLASKVQKYIKTHGAPLHLDGPVDQISEESWKIQYQSALQMRLNPVLSSPLKQKMIDWQSQQGYFEDPSKKSTPGSVVLKEVDVQRFIQAIQNGFLVDLSEKQMKNLRSQVRKLNTDSRLRITLSDYIANPNDSNDAMRKAQFLKAQLEQADRCLGPGRYSIELKNVSPEICRAWDRLIQDDMKKLLSQAMIEIDNYDQKSRSRFLKRKREGEEQITRLLDSGEPDQFKSLKELIAMMDDPNSQYPSKVIYQEINRTFNSIDSEIMSSRSGLKKILTQLREELSQRSAAKVEANAPFMKDPKDATTASNLGHRWNKVQDSYTNVGDVPDAGSKKILGFHHKPSPPPQKKISEQNMPSSSKDGSFEEGTPSDQKESHQKGGAPSKGKRIPD